MLTTFLRSCAAVALSLGLAGCTSLLGDFSYDPNPASGGSSGIDRTDDVQGDIVLTPAKGLITTEQGAKATFTIHLKRQPTANVAIVLSSSNEAEGKISPISVSFTPDNYKAPQAIQITGQDDALPDHNQSYTIRTAPASSDDSTYYGLDPLDAQVTNVDDDTAGFLVTPLAGLATSESGGEATFTITLTHAPTGDVTIGLSSDTESEGTVSPAALVFTPLNWMAPQIVTVTGVNDDAADGPKPFHILTAAARSSDAEYNLLDPPDVEVVNQDNDTAGITLTPSTGLVTFENGAMTSFGIALNSPPSANVTLGLTSSNELEGTVSPSSVTFTSLNWMAPQVVAVTGKDDSKSDGNQPYLIVTGRAESDDRNYAGVKGPDAQILNIDDDTAGITVSPLTGLVTGEMGDTTSFTVKLNTKPTGDVTLDLISTRMDEGVPSPAQLVFDGFNWAAEQTVMVTGQDDPIADGMQTYTVHVRPNAASADGAYLALNEVDVPLSNIDNDSPGITVTAGPGLTTNEDGSAATFSVVLNSKPTAEVSIALTSSNRNEGTVTPNRVVFTPENYNAPQTATVKGVDDAMADGNQPYRIITEGAISGDANYSARNAANVDVTNIDNDSPGIIVTPANQQLTTTENGTTATFSVVLQSQPNADVDIGVSSSNLAEGTVSPGNLKFTQNNWNAPQVVTVKGVNDDRADGDQTFRIALAAAVSDDANYKARDALDVTVKNVDNDTPGITIQNRTPNPLVTTEAGGVATFQVVLNSQPTANVVIPVSSSRTGEGTVSPGQLTFTAANWAAPQTVTVMGADDRVADGDQIYRVVTAPAVSDDPLYKGRDAVDPTVSNVDNDSPGFTVTPTSGLVTSEAGVTATFTVVLNSQPTADVTLALHSTKLAEGTISPGTLTFTPANWNAPRGITVMGVDDSMQDGSQPYSVVIDAATSADAGYAGRDPADVSLLNTDDDSAGFTIVAATPVLVTKENGATASFTVALNSEPKADVTIALTSSDPSEGEVSPAALTFTALNWKAPQKVTVTGQDDNVADGDQPYLVETGAATSADANYKDMDPADVALSNEDNDSPGIIVTAAAGLTTSESGDTATFSVALRSQPTAPVSIGVTSGDPTEGTVSTATLVFSMSDWAAPKLVTVSGVDDDVADGGQPYTVVLAAATSTDAGYAGLNPPDISVTNTDNDSAGIVLSPVAPTGTTSEDGDSFTFKVKLSSKPTADVVIPLSSSNEGEGLVSPPSLTFTTVNWNALQTVTVTGVNDDVADGAQPYVAVLDAATSADLGYDGMNHADVVMSNTDNDSAGIAVSLAAGDTTELGGSTTFTIKLRSQPTDSVVIPLHSSKATEGSLLAAMAEITFNTANWNSAQTITVYGEDDKVADGDQHYSIITGPAVSNDAAYADMNADDVALVNIDDDSPGITVSAASGPTSEAGGTATFTVVLHSQPTAAVSIAIESNNPDEGTIVETSIEFTPGAAGNWGTPHTITVHGVGDDVADGDQGYKIILHPATSADPAYANRDAADVDFTNTDDDSAGLDVSPAANDISETGTSTTFSIKLHSRPTANVVVPLTISDETEAELDVSSVTITPAMWKTGEEVTVTGVQDDEADGPQDLKVLTGTITSGDPDYAGLNPPDVDIRTLDEDSAAIVVDPPAATHTGEDPAAPSVSFSIVLTSAPTHPVTISVTSLNTDEGEVLAPATGQLVFNAGNWNDPQPVTIQGVEDDGTVDGDLMYTLQLGPAVSADPDYDGRDPMDLQLTNDDNDVPPIPDP